MACDPKWSRPSDQKFATFKLLIRTGVLPRWPTMAQQLRPGEIVPESGVYRVTHEPAHVGALCQVTFIRGRRFPSCPHCRGIGFELLQSDEVDWRHRSARRSRRRGTRRISKFVRSATLREGKSPASKLPRARSAFLIAVLSGLCWAVLFGIAIGLHA
jgi:hypothetical protein